MNFITGALPNIMFIAGIIAIGLALGIELKIVEIKGELSKGGRLGAFGVGVVLIAASVFLYTRPESIANAPDAPPAAQPIAAQQQNIAASAAPTAPLAASPLPTAAPAASTKPTAPPTAPPTATPEPTAPPTDTPLPTAPPTDTPLPTAPPTEIAIPADKAGQTVPDIRGQSTKDARKALDAANLQLGEKHDSCEELGISEEHIMKADKGRIMCQSPLPGSIAAPNTRVVYVLADD